jgi:Cu2+-exporting ATPase
MKLLGKLFKSLKGDQIENYYGHGAHKHESSPKDGDEHQRQAKYQCPMKCEGDKTYDEPGNCPVCNMKLALVSDTNSHGHQQSKETNHNH